MKNMMGMCLNRNVVIGLAVVGVGLFMFAPNLAAAALPLLFFAVCPLSMALMAVMMGRGMKGGMSTSQTDAGGQYTCPMHPKVANDRPGRCPECGMELVETAISRQVILSSKSENGAVTGREAEMARLRAQLQQTQEQQAAIYKRIRELEQPEPVEQAPSR